MDFLNKISTSKLTNLVLVLALVLLPLLLLPLGFSPIDSTKQFLIMTAMVCLLGLFGIHLAQKHWLYLPLHPFLLPLTGIGISVLVSTLIFSPYPQQLFLGMSGALVSFVVISIIGSWLSSKNLHLSLPLVFTSVGAVIGLLTLLDVFKVGSGLLYTFILSLPSQPPVGFSPAGSFFMVGQFCAVAAAMGITAILSSKTKLPKPLLLVTTAFNIIGVVVAIWYCLPGKDTTPLLLPWTANWSIAVDALRTPRTALFGLGPDNFVDAYTLLKPSWLNYTNLWNVEFTQARSLFFSVLTTQGLFGLLCWTTLFIAILRNIRNFFSTSPALTVGLLTLLAIQLVFPPTLLMLGTLGVLLAALMAATNTMYSSLALTPLTIHVLPVGETKYQSNKKYSFIVNLITVSLILISAVAVGYRTVTTMIADYFGFQATVASADGDALKIYQLQQNAITFNPYDSHYHRSYALTNMYIAEALSQKTDATEEDKQNVTALIQQAIREARLATSIAPNRTQNWEVLGDIYTNLIGTAADAETWAAEVYRQSILTSPTNPLLYVKLGTIFASQKNYNVALQLFDQAAQLKPDLIAPYYTAATTLKQAKNKEGAKTAYEQTLSVIEQTLGTSSPEYSAVSKELAELETMADTEEPTNSDADDDNDSTATSSASLSLTDTVLENPSTELESSNQIELNDSTRELLEELSDN